MNKETKRLIRFIDKDRNMKYWTDMRDVLNHDFQDSVWFGFELDHPSYFIYTQSWLVDWLYSDADSQLHQDIWDEFFDKVDLRKVCEYFFKKMNIPGTNSSNVGETEL